MLLYFYNDTFKSPVRYRKKLLDVTRSNREHLHLNKDSTFNYRFAGDLINKVGHGRYYLNKDTLILLIHKNEPKTITDSLTDLPYLRDTIRLLFSHGIKDCSV